MDGKIAVGANMKLSKLYIKNFRNIKEIELEFTDFTVLVGQNNVGKSNILQSIYKVLKIGENPARVYFSEQDFHYDYESNDRADEIVIELYFSALTDDDHSAFFTSGIDFGSDTICIRLEARWDKDNNDAVTEIFFKRNDDVDNIKGNNLRLRDKRYIPYYLINAYRDAQRETISSRGDLREILKEFNKNYLKPLSIQMGYCKDSISQFLSENSNGYGGDLLKVLNEMVSCLESSDPEMFCEKYDSLTDLLDRNPQFSDDDLFNRLNADMTNLYHKIEVDNQLKKLNDAVNSLNEIGDVKHLLSEYMSLFTPEIGVELEIGKISESEIFDDTNIRIKDIPILRQGSGFQSSFVIALKLCRMMSYLKSAEESISNIIIAIEEPEAHMHPHLQRSLIKQLIRKNIELTSRSISRQFIITSHSPFILSQVEKSDICLIKNENGINNVIRLDDNFMTNIVSEMPPEKLKHFDLLFRQYPEIFLSNGIIIVEGLSEYGALPEFAKKMDIDLDGLGLTVITTQSKDSMKYIYLILKNICKCVAIRDNEGTNKDEDLIANQNEFYFKTQHKDFEAEIVSSVGYLEIIKILIQVDPENLGSDYLSVIYTSIEQTRGMSSQEIVNNWDSLDFSKLSVSNECVIKYLKENCKTALIYSKICSQIDNSKIPDCYSKVLNTARDMVK